MMIEMLKRVLVTAGVALFSFSLHAEPMGTPANDGEIARVLTTLSDGEIDAAKIELSHGSNADARSFAKGMIEQHKRNIDETKAVAKSNSLDPKDSDLSKSLTTDAKSNNGDLKKASKSGFDKAYIEQQIRMHQEALDVIDQKLLPKVENPNLKEHLTKTRQTVAAHLSHAKEISAKF